MKEEHFTKGEHFMKEKHFMDKAGFSTPLSLKDIQVNDEFWDREQELVRREVIPYQWEALNDRVPGAAPSYCMRNFKVAGRMMGEEKEQGASYVAPAYTFRGFEALPEDPKHPDEEKFYGFVFQDSDFSKWIEAVGYSLARYPDQILEQTADEAIDIVCAAQMENGYLDTYYIINGMDRAFTHLKDHHELYCLGHLIEGAVAYYQATGKDKLLKAAMSYADYVYSCFGQEEGKCKGYPGHEIAEMALIRLYEVTGEEKYLELGLFFLNQRGTQPYYFDEEEKERAEYEGRVYKPNTDPMRYAYYQAHLPVREQDEALGHSVRAAYLYCGMADLARVTGDEAMFAACERLWNNITGKKMYLTGGIGSTHIGEAFSFAYDLPNDTAYSETCAAIGLVFFARRMLQMKADRKYADVMERALYNGVLSGMALDGKSFFYVNPLEVVPEACKKDARKFHVKPVRQKWFGCACCPPNIARLLSSAAAYAYTGREDTLWVHLYMGSVLTRKVGEKSLDIKLETGFPWNGGVQASIHAEQPVKYTLAFRIPGWCGEGNAVVKNGGKQTEIVLHHNGITVRRTNGEASGAVESVQEEASVIVEIKDGYLYLTGEWQDEDTVTLDFPMKVRTVSSNLKVRENIGKVAFARGPIVYCMEEADNGPDLHLCKADLEAILDGKGIRVEESEELGHRMMVLKVPGKRISEVSGEENALYTDFVMEEEHSMDVTLTMVPYYAWNNRGEGEMAVWIHRCL